MGAPHPGRGRAPGRGRGRGRYNSRGGRELNRSVNPQKSAPVTSKACARARTTGCDLVMVGIIAKSSINDLGAWANG